MNHRSFVACALLTLLIAAHVEAQAVVIDPLHRAQTIDGFGTCIAGKEPQEDWWQQLYFDDLGASILRMDLVPRFKSPYSDNNYNSPWFGLNPELPGPERNNTRTYTNASDYTKQWGGRSAQIAVMGPNIDKNVEYFDYDEVLPKSAGMAARAGVARTQKLGDFKLVGSVWSPAPWLKLSSGKRIGGNAWPLPMPNTAWPFIWNANYAGGLMDTSGIPRPEFDDSALGGQGPTSALTQMARGLAAYLRGFQRKFGVTLYAVSIQNELNFEQFYNSCAYPKSSDYIAAVKVVRKELDRYPDLKKIRIIGPEDLMGSDAYGLWEYGGDHGPTHKNLQYLAAVAKDPEASKAIDFACIHGYASDGIDSAGAQPKVWEQWVNGWESAPAPGLPSDVKGFTSFYKKSWMTETSGEEAEWLAPKDGYPKDGAFSIAVKLHQALTVGRESAWIYWQLSDGKTQNPETLTDEKTRAAAPKFVAAKHFFRYIRPGAVRIDANVSDADDLLASAYAHEGEKTLTVVLVNTSDDALTATLQLGRHALGASNFDAFASHNGSYLKASKIPIDAATNEAKVTVPGYGVVTLQAQRMVFVPERKQGVSLSESNSSSTAQSGMSACGCHALGSGGETTRSAALAGAGAVALAGLTLRQARRLVSTRRRG